MGLDKGISMKPVRRTIVMRDGVAYYRNSFVGTTPVSLDMAFKLPSNGKFRVIIKEGGPYKIVKGNYFYRISKDDEYCSSICKVSFRGLFFKPDGRKRYSIQVKVL